jgi:hypothetical protein
MFHLPKRACLPVIHVEYSAQALRNVHVAFENGAHGIFLINHSITSQQLLTIFCQIRRLFPRAWIGLNCLGLEPAQILTIVPPDVSGIWVDSVDIRADLADPSYNARRYRAIQKATAQRWKGLFFGGVAFKYQPQFGDPASDAKLAAPFVDVITTSGSGTGSAPDVDKIRLMKEAVPDKPLAIASGMTPENIRLFLPYADYFLVATGISDSHTELNPARVRTFADAMGETH